MSNNKSDSTINIRPRRSVGSTNIPTYTIRKTKIFAINESELDIISHYNTASMVYFSLGGFFLPMLIEELAHRKEGFCYSFLGLIAFVVASYGFGVWAWFGKKSIVARIKEESEPSS